ncbi:Coatomer subunit zeta [Astathelohania contejeani]|uniref:Coatomer subunit zeta n=1 Tax=Astathelohania contejeani TaxID=164912 RepID=A0ABQ7HYV0_9MICR|nr:Coatomer subunit zeta [Thelohania contejeani]
MNIYDLEGIAIMSRTGDVIFHKTFINENILNDIYSRIINERCEISFLEDHIVLYKMIEDVIILFYASCDVNEIFISKEFDIFYSALLRLFDTPITKDAVFSKYDQVILLVDNLVYEGIFIEDDSEALIKSIPKRNFEGLESMKIPKGFVSFFSRSKK